MHVIHVLQVCVLCGAPRGGQPAITPAAPTQRTFTISGRPIDNGVTLCTRCMFGLLASASPARSPSESSLLSGALSLFGVSKPTPAPTLSDNARKAQAHVGHVFRIVQPLSEQELERMTKTQRGVEDTVKSWWNNFFG